MPLTDFLIRIITGRDDGCYVRIKEQADGYFELTLLSPNHTGFLTRSPREPYEDKEVVDCCTVSADQVAKEIESWHDY